jgi:hypothetical protein
MRGRSLMFLGWSFGVWGLREVTFALDFDLPIFWEAKWDLKGEKIMRFHCF